jgi:type I restriction enzyme, S subunit
MSDWKNIKLYEIGKVVTGKTPETIDSTNYGSDYMFISPSDLHKHFIITNSEKMISAKGLSRIKGSILDGISILVGCIGWDMGNVALVNAKCATNQQINSITQIKESYNPYYIYYWFKQKKQYLFQIASVTRTPMLKKSDFSNIELNIPNKIQQDKVVVILSSLDSKIALNNRINAELEAMAKTIYDYWFVQFDFPAPSPSGRAGEGSPYKSSGGKMVWCEELKREVPEGWEVKTIASIADCNKWTINNKTNFEFIYYLDTSNLTNNQIDSFICISCKTDKIPSRALRVIALNDILISTVRPNQCHYGIIKEPISNMIASSGFAQIRSKKESISNDLLYFYLTDKKTIERLQQIAETSVSAYPSISPTDILNLKFCFPKDAKILTEANKLFDSLNSKISKNQQENQQLSSLRDWLLPMLMNGQVKTNNLDNN